MSRRRGSGFSIHILTFALSAFLLSFTMNLSFERLSQAIPLAFGVPLFLFVVILGVLSDAVGLAGARAKEEVLLSMASRKVTGAREAIWFVRNAPKVSSVFSDLMGDVAATLSGALAVAMAYKIREWLPGIGWALATSAAVGTASFLSVGGKALFKPLTLKYAESIILFLGKTRRTVSRALGERKN